MRLTRRDFVKYSAGALATGALVCAPAVFAREAALPAGRSAETGERTATAICPMCAQGCGLSVRVVNGKAVKVDGNPLHPVNQGVLCPKGQAVVETLYSPERLRQPMLRSDRATGDYRPISWDEALGLLAAQLGALRDQGLSHTVACLFGETQGQLRALIRRFCAAYGTPNAIDVYEPDVLAARLAMYLMQGVNGLPVYQWENARYVLSFGGSFLEGGQHTLTAASGVGFMRRSAISRGRIVVVDPRFSVSAAKADEWVPIRPGAFGALALGIANVLIQGKLYDDAFVRDCTFGFEDFTDEAGARRQGFKSLVLKEYTLERVEAITGVPAADIARLAGEFAAGKPAIAMLPVGRATLPAGNALGSAMAVHALNALVGAIDAPGGVAVQRYPRLAEWPALPADAVSARGRAMERLDGAGTARFPLALSAYQELPARILAGQPYALNALILCGANPIFDSGRGAEFAQALAKTPFVASLSHVLDESSAHADLVLPLSHALESWSDSYVEGVGFAGLAAGRPAVAPLYNTRSAADVFLALAQRLGGGVAQALPWSDYQALLQARLAGSQIKWDDLLEKGAWSQMVYFHAEPGSKVWVNEVVGADRLNTPRDGRFDFFSREMYNVLASQGTPAPDRSCLPHFDPPMDSVAAQDYPFVLAPQQLMTQGRGSAGVAPALQEVYGLQAGQRWGSWVELSAAAGRALGIKDGDLVAVESARGALQARARLNEGLWPNAVMMPLGQGRISQVAWGGGHEPKGIQHIGANPLLLAATVTEPLCGVPAITPTRVKVYKV